jgi:hypothetical protein
MGFGGEQDVQVQKGCGMKKLDLNFLTSLRDQTEIIAGSEIQTLVADVMSVLRENRGTGRLSDAEVATGNRFVLAMNFMFMDIPDYPLDITEYDLDYIIVEEDYMRMGNNRN